MPVFGTLLKTLLLIVALILVLSESCLAADIYIRSGSSGQGTRESPLGTLWSALEKAVRGDVIHIAEGIYSGKGGSGSFLVTVPRLTIVGGYTADFSIRHPFVHLTVLQRAPDYRGDWTGLKEGILEGREGTDHSGMIIDGLVLDARSRNDYYENGDINPAKSFKGALFRASKPAIRIRNCILLNPYGEGISATWQGKENEISNTFILNAFYCGISLRASQPKAVVSIKNCTVLFTWDQPGKGGGISVFIGRLGRTVLENNIFGFARDHAVTNSFGNEDTIMKNNVFFQCHEGYYKYMDSEQRNLSVWNTEGVADLNQNAESYLLLDAEGNVDTDPQLKPDSDYFDRFSNFVAAEPGKLDMDAINQWRRSVGLNLEANQASARKNQGMAYPLAAVVPSLLSSLPSRGVRKNGPFQSYASTTTAPDAIRYESVPFTFFEKGSGNARELKGLAVSFTAGQGLDGTTWLLHNAPSDDYRCVKLLLPGQSDLTRDFVYGYILKGSSVHKDWDRFFRSRDPLEPEAVRIEGTAWYAGNDNYPFPVGIIIDTISREP